MNDRAGNPGQTTHTLTVDTAAPTVTIATVAGDDIINNAEQLAGQTISGTTTAEVGQTVTVTFNGQSYGPQRSAAAEAGGLYSGAAVCRIKRRQLHHQRNGRRSGRKYGQRQPWRDAERRRPYRHHQHLRGR